MTLIKKSLILPLILALLLAVILIPAHQAYASYGDRITVSGTQFYAGGQRIWINGGNTPWDNWNDFGGSYDSSWWNNEFAQLKANGINATRVWIICNGETGVNIDNSGYVSGATSAFWSDLDSLFQLAQNNHIYLEPTLLSFDVVENSHTNYTSWRNMFASHANVDSFVNNVVTPFVTRYSDNPYVWAIDLMNEPDWGYENDGVSWSNMQYYFAKVAVAIHQNSSILTTVGIAMIKYSSTTTSGAQGNKVSDSALQAQVNDPNARLDFYTIHHYPWMDQYWGIPNYQTPSAYGLPGDRPSVIGEQPATGMTGHTITEDYENAYLNGWQGVMPWTTNGVDSNGSLSDMAPGTNAFNSNHPQLVYPSGSSDSANYNFESGTQGFHEANSNSGIAINTSTDQAYAGSRSLKLTVSSSSGTDYYVQTDNPSGLNGGATITFHVWVPAGESNLTAIQPYIEDNNWTWTGNYQSYSSLTKGAWNTLTVQVPSGAATPIREVGVQVSTTGSLNNSLYVDSISW